MFLRYECRFFSKRKRAPKKKIIKRNLFLVSLEYKVALDEVDKQLNDHRAFLEECYSKNLFITSGEKFLEPAALSSLPFLTKIF